jgi:hypothetical protein
VLGEPWFRRERDSFRAREDYKRRNWHTDILEDLREESEMSIAKKRMTRRSVLEIRRGKKLAMMPY